eukprot:TRINITY_DN21347_c0_g1_i1.p1 TRINITY_DN21347_c0_g1~~TRINITY_DN21347_c0_g1_i1.p1  ORF type:complete len:345 (+),score=76.99 TRINITY_DN21347_c0_g1_i1:80-1114(+)
MTTAVIPSMRRHDPYGSHEARKAMEEAARYKPTMKQFSFPADEDFFEQLVHAVQRFPQNLPLFQLKASHAQGQVRVNQQFLCGFVRGWEQANPHRVSLQSSVGATAFHAAQEFWDLCTKMLRNVGKPMAAIATGDLLKVESNLEPGRPMYCDVKDWNGMCAQWEEVKWRPEETALQSTVRNAALAVEPARRATPSMEDLGDPLRRHSRRRRRATAPRSDGDESSDEGTTGRMHSHASHSRGDRGHTRPSAHSQHRRRRSDDGVSPSPATVSPPHLYAAPKAAKPFAARTADGIPTFATAGAHPPPVQAPPLALPGVPASLIPPAPAAHGGFWKYGVLHYHVHQH